MREKLRELEESLIPSRSDLFKHGQKIATSLHEEAVEEAQEIYGKKLGSSYVELLVDNTEKTRRAVAAAIVQVLYTGNSDQKINAITLLLDFSSHVAAKEAGAVDCSRTMEALFSTPPIFRE